MFIIVYIYLVSQEGFEPILRVFDVAPLSAYWLICLRASRMAV